MVGDIRGQGLLWTLEFVTLDKSGSSFSANPILATHVMFGLKSKKIIVGITGERSNIVLFSPPMCFTVANSRRSVVLVKCVGYKNFHVFFFLCHSFCYALDEVLAECARFRNGSTGDLEDDPETGEGEALIDSSPRKRTVQLPGCLGERRGCEGETDEHMSSEADSNEDNAGNVRSDLDESDHSDDDVSNSKRARLDSTTNYDDLD